MTWLGSTSLNNKRVRFALTQAITRTNDSGTLGFLAQVLSETAARLDPKEAAARLTPGFGSPGYHSRTHSVAAPVLDPVAPLPPAH